MSELGEDRVPEETRTEIMEATFRAVSEHGYADLRMRDIGEEMEKTRQIIHYHYDGKYDLLANFLEYIIEQYEGSVEVDRDVPPREELDLRVRQCLFGPGFEEFDHWERMKVYHELFTHAQNDERHRKIFDEHHRRLRGGITQVVTEGIEQGEFRNTDPERTGQLITDVIHAARERKLSLGHDDAPEQALQAIDEFVIDSLIVEE
ncbi:TetR/AcrR family transcriptional regulator [Halolamina sediminis]|uniref:TetR/AcrR family transcriptional regulator n=1 Tax=Halolamina sediminis TaxID=1480675 RepID=UPI0006B57611|nr:TetR/AcrR family transcriptional regulator [Halolamina sediminis]